VEKNLRFGSSHKNIIINTTKLHDNVVYRAENDGFSWVRMTTALHEKAPPPWPKVLATCFESDLCRDLGPFFLFLSQPNYDFFFASGLLVCSE
jgi:hypothetical protein